MERGYFERCYNREDAVGLLVIERHMLEAIEYVRFFLKSPLKFSDIKHSKKFPIIVRILN